MLEKANEAAFLRDYAASEENENLVTQVTALESTVDDLRTQARMLVEHLALLSRGAPPQPPLSVSKPQSLFQ